MVASGHGHPGDTVTWTFPDGRKLAMTETSIRLADVCGIGVQLDEAGFHWVNTLVPGCPMTNPPEK